MREFHNWLDLVAEKSVIGAVANSVIWMAA
jgi:hypothetical protein